INGTVDTGDPSVLEIMYVLSSTCTGGNCGGTLSCTGELIGPQTVLTAGHCTDTSAGGEISGQGGPAIKMCTSAADINNIFQMKATSNGCNVAVLVLFNNQCTTNDNMETCEVNLIQAKSYIIADKLVNPSYSPGGNPDNDIGLVHMTAKTLASGAG